jgi:hypothetical protein
MVARRFDTNTASPAPRGFFAELFEMWRRLVSRLGDVLVGLRARFAPAETAQAAERPWLLRRGIIWLGLGALALGFGVGVLLAPPGLPRSLAVWAGVQALLWAGVRWLLMTLTGRGVARDRASLLGASSLGLLAYALAVTPGLSVVAWTGSAALTWLGLVNLGDDRQEASRTVAIAWGAQAVVVAASWLARNAVMAILTSRG